MLRGSVLTSPQQQGAGHTSNTTNNNNMGDGSTVHGDTTTAAIAASSTGEQPQHHQTGIRAMFSQLTSNPYFHAGAGLYTLTIGAVIGRYGLRMMTEVLKRKFVVSIETTNRDPAYEWLVQWMAAHPTFSYKQMSVMTSGSIIHANDETTVSKCTFAPSPNIPHYLMDRGWPYMVYRKRQVERAAGSDVLEILEMSTVGLSNKRMHEIVEEARKQASDRDSDRTVIFQNAGGRWTRNQDARSRRPLNSVVLEGNMRTQIIDDVRLFLDSSGYYRKLGVPYRRGYLLHGPPGCGKSSLVMALAGELRLAICILSLSNRSLDDESLNSLLNCAPMKSIVLIEDIDRAFTNDSRVTMSGLLNALDGVAAQEGRLVFMTTNHVERLDAALIRPGRADLKMEIGYVSRPQAFQFFKKFFPEATDELATDFSKSLPDGTISVAQLQNHLFLHRNDAQQAVKKSKMFVDDVNAFEEKLEAKRERDHQLRSMMSAGNSPRIL